MYILFKKSKIYIAAFKTLLHVSITRPSSGSKSYNLKHSVNYFVMLTLLRSMHNQRRTTITKLILNTVRLTHKNTTCCHSTKVKMTK